MKDHYRQTWFESECADVTGAFAIITAHNPFGEIHSSRVNAAADQRLGQRLREMGLEPFRVTGCSADRTHAEAGWGAVMTLDDAIRTGREFEQDAIFWIENGTLHLVCLKTLAREPVCPWKERVQSPAIPYFTLHLGASPPEFILSAEDEAKVSRQVLEFFQGFTLQRGKGFFLGAVEDVFVISIATHDLARLLELAARLRRDWRQKGVGIHGCGHYLRVTEVSDLLVLRQVLTGLVSGIASVHSKPLASAARAAQTAVL